MLQVYITPHLEKKDKDLVGEKSDLTLLTFDSDFCIVLKVCFHQLIFAARSDWQPGPSCSNLIIVSLDIGYSQDVNITAD